MAKLIVPMVAYRQNKGRKAHLVDPKPGAGGVVGCRVSVCRARFILDEAEEVKIKDIEPEDFCQSCLGAMVAKK